MINILVTGASGFVGRRLCAQLIKAGYDVKAVLRGIAPAELDACEIVRFSSITPDTEWMEALDNVDVVIHLAATVHLVNKKSAISFEQYRDFNVGVTAQLAKSAALSKVKQFIFMSSIKVNGERTLPGQPITEKSVQKPEGFYAISKWEAEQALRKISDQFQLPVTIVRPPLIYGPEVKANFLTMMKWVERGLPLPFGSVDNKRSLLALDNLCDLLIVCLLNPNAVNQTFVACDAVPLSTTQLLIKLAHALGVPVRQVKIPVPLLMGVANLFGRGDIAGRLLDSLEVDMTHTCESLGWTPPLSTEHALSLTVESFIRHQQN